ncbi:uncharacterized protein LOC104849035 isoform X4 [Fukomys damarensis]|uniref:uncharacterized protein LOC104849035 isoform X4 n=1 Tax=Fukomys damarensis TaxID=885580 RepID=UPI001455209B|nr:uncharacterized protein LOC104849035 isoform X4 [Fukomys damarensis]
MPRLQATAGPKSAQCGFSDGTGDPIWELPCRPGSSGLFPAFYAKWRTAEPEGTEGPPWASLLSVAGYWAAPHPSRVWVCLQFLCALARWLEDRVATPSLSQCP